MLFMGNGEHTEAQIEERKKQFDRCYSYLSGIQQGGHCVPKEEADQWVAEMNEHIGLFLQKFAEDFDLKLDWCEKATLIED